ncbi:hypothetical protein GGR53DRAFT_415750 [Hypoxylon sp. FL1150]|nr:hypothetical protein GGR53DRAFT_415750 [Hypoxylon sp. FL1150]
MLGVSSMFFLASRPFASFACAILTTATAVSTTCSSSGKWDLCSIGLSSETEVFWSDDLNFANETTQRYTNYKPPTYSAAIVPTSETDVQKIVRFASEHNISILATGGGHGFTTTLANLRDGLEIDLSSLKEISIDEKASTVTVGGGVLLKEIIEPLFNAGKELQTGPEACVGLIGSTLGGGIGRLNGLHGLIIDSLISVRIVVASGELITASKTENSDLFWAIRGAGFNYGIVSSATYKVHDLSNGGEVMNADFLFPTNETTTVFEFFKSLETTIPAELSLILNIGYRDSLGGTYVALNAVYFGSQDDGIPLIQPLVDASPLQYNISTVPYLDLLSSAFFGASPSSAPCQKNTLRNVYGIGLKNYDVPTLQKYFMNLTGIYANYPDVRDSVFFFEAFPMQAARAVSDDETSYPHRDINGHLIFNYGYTDRSLDGIVNEFAVNARAEFAANSGFDDIKNYVSYGHGDETAAQLYGEDKLPKLRALRAIWDSKGLFSFNEPF